MPTEMGPCRFSQYNVFMKNTARALCIRDLAFFSPNAATGYMELGPDFVRSAWQAVVIAGLMYDVRALLKVAAPDKDRALAVLDDQWQKLCKAFERGRQATWETLESVAQELAGIKLQVKPQAVPKVLLAGEIYVRFDDLCCGAMEDYYAKQGIMMKRPDVTEWLLYTDWLNLHRAASGMQGSGQAVSDMRSLSFLFRHWGKGMLSGDATAMAFARVRFKMWYETLIEQKARRILQRSGLLVTRQHGIDELVRHGAALLDPALEGEAILTIGTSLQLLDPSSDENYCGVVLVGPFNCMPSGVAESILKPHLRRKGIPFLMFQTDGNPIPSNLWSQMEVHAHRVSHVAETRQGRHT
jgi:predicted nucleotide-binding protein (sugar kinase/HSP70/actin superfamily)